MVSNTTLLHIHQRQKEIFATPSNQLFAGLRVIVVGDMYQLPRIQRKLVFDEYKNNVYDLCHLWNLLKMEELTEIMRQKDDQPFTELLNRFRTASQTEEDDKVIQSNTSFSTDANYTHHNKMLITPILHTFFLKNCSCNYQVEHNNVHLENLITLLH